MKSPDKTTEESTPVNQIKPSRNMFRLKGFQAVLEFFWLILKVIMSVFISFIKCFIPVRKENISGKNVLITGAAHGIGKELAYQYGKLGARVVCVDINKTLNDATVNELTSHGISASSYHCNIECKADVENLANKISKEVGVIDILVNNAGVLFCKKLLDHTEMEVQRTFNVNIIGQFWMLQAFLPAMIKENKGHVVAIASVAGLEGKANTAAYCATKFAIRGLMESIADESKECSWNIQFTTVCPFFVDTGMCKKPKIRFENLFGIQSTKKVAAAIISAQRSGEKEVTIPSVLRFGFNLSKILPLSAHGFIQDFIGLGFHPSSR